MCFKEGGSDKVAELMYRVRFSIEIAAFKGAEEIKLWESLMGLFPRESIKFCNSGFVRFNGYYGLDILETEKKRKYSDLFIERPVNLVSKTARLSIEYQCGLSICT